MEQLQPVGSDQALAVTMPAAVASLSGGTILAEGRTTVPDLHVVPALPRVPSNVYPRFVKPAIDVVAGVILLALAAPMLVLLSVAVFLSLGPGVLYRQERVGRDGRVFKMYKFRTMAPDRRQASLPFDGPDRRVCHKRDDDPRHTRVGRFLRQWSLDELPQLWNVVRGDMSLVGPRPELVSVVATYEEWQHSRHAAKPGLTGLWQVTHRGAGVMKDFTDVDLAYIRQLSFGQDVRILARTIPALLGRCRGS